MIKDRVISISDLRTNATKIINDLPKTGDKYIFVHNKPKAVLVDIDWFENARKKINVHGIEFDTPDNYETTAIEEYDKKEKK
ncbi:MAG: type II toxin-antitoxin system Phd/YefM family antitoxin [Candidatus Peribacteria bacterium]|nr:MAG: type II toxin-antitoxin system Phd/YefM family antitoxin [Candidatus Peribacteria bacterium]